MVKPMDGPGIGSTNRGRPVGPEPLAANKIRRSALWLLPEEFYYFLTGKDLYDVDKENLQGFIG